MQLERVYVTSSFGGALVKCMYYDDSPDLKLGLDSEPSFKKAFLRCRGGTNSMYKRAAYQDECYYW